MNGKKVTDAKIELRSEKVRKIVGEMPRALYWWSIGILILIMVIIALILCTMPFPISDGESILTSVLKRIFGL